MRITEAEGAEMVRLYTDECLSTTEIAARFGRVQTVVQRYLRRNGVPMRSPGYRRPGYVRRPRFGAPSRHGLSGHPLYKTHRQMMHRCYSPAMPYFADYGGRGVGVYLAWHDPAEFIRWIEGNLGARPEGMTLDRINNGGHYEPGNVRWATRETQAGNQRRRSTSNLRVAA